MGKQEVQKKMPEEKRRGGKMRWWLLVLSFGLLLPVGGKERSLSLNGSWRLDYFPQPEAAPVRTVPIRVPFETVSATVPGNCELDLVRAGVLPDVEVGLNALSLRPYEGCQWLYTKSFLAPERESGERFELRFDGIDTLADVFVNGEKVGEAENMLIGHRFDVTAQVRPGKENVVQVLLRSVAVAARDETVGMLGHFVGSGADGEPFRKAFHMGGWDIMPRVFAAGLWRDVALETVGACGIDQVFWMTKKLDVKSRRAEMNVYSRIRCPWNLIERAKVRYSLSAKGRTVYEDVRTLHGYQNFVTFSLSDCEAWWPRGMGEPFLYDAKIELLDADGRILASDARMCGVRTVALEREDWRSPERPGQFLFRVNGEPCFVRGTNWTPLDAFHGRDAQRLEPTLAMLADLNCNMVRVWGGGVYEPDRFFDWCDANGVMVWQDFMMGCSVFPFSEDFQRRLRKEVLSVVLRLRSHPSLVLWSGNNENDGSYPIRVGAAFAPDPNRDVPSRVTIPNVLVEFDVTRPYLPSSPYCSPEVFAGRAKMSEDHLWGGYLPFKHPFYTNSVAHFISETGYHGCPEIGSLKRMFTREGLWPWRDGTLADWNDEWRFKATAPLMDGKMQPWMYHRRLDQIRIPLSRYFGETPTNLVRFAEFSQYVQAEAYKFFIEMHRSRKFGRSNGLIWWNLKDGWPILSDAVVDFYGCRKRAYYAIRNVQRDQLVALNDDHEVFAVNDSLHEVTVEAVVRDSSGARELLRVKKRLPSNARVSLGKLELRGKGVVFIEYAIDGRGFRNHYVYGEPPHDFSMVKGAFEWDGGGL